MKALLYFGYFIKNTNYKGLIRSFRETKNKEQLSYLEIIMDMVIASFKYKSSFHDYFLFEFYKKNHEERDSFLTTGRSYEFYTTLNDKKWIDNFRNKAKFNRKFKEFIKRDFMFLDNCSVDKFIEWVRGKDYIIAKPNEGVAGRGIEKINVKDYNNLNELYSYLKKKKLDLVEDFIKQHDEMNRMNPSSVNTIRVITVTDDANDKTDIIYSFFRIGVGSHIDNFSAGGIAAPIDVKTGKVRGPGISKCYSKNYERHPRTNVMIDGFEIPFWNDVISLVIKASRVVPQVRTVGWDIAITENGPELIEGNDNWGKDAFQLLDGIGKGYILNKYIRKNEQIIK